MSEKIDHPPHYGGDMPFEPIKVIEAWGLGFHLGNALKYIARWESKGGLDDLRKAIWYINRFIEISKADAEVSARAKMAPVENHCQCGSYTEIAGSLGQCANCLRWVPVRLQ
jgi:hypothetical protein